MISAGVDRTDLITVADTTTGVYRVARLRSGATTEYRCYRQVDYEDRHFLSIIEADGAFVARPHPGVDPNGWGTSSYLQPFLPRATLAHATVSKVSATPGGIEVEVGGFVSRGAAKTFGEWGLCLDFAYDGAAKKVSGTGAYDIELADSLSAATGDLNLMKLASNYLRNVPLLDRPTGDTGDMRHVSTVSDNGVSTWIPWRQPAHYPSDLSDGYDITMVGQYNDIHTEELGHARIAAAHKPTVRIALQSATPGVHMAMGYAFRRRKATLFWADNIGVTPMILKSSPHKTYSFDIRYESTALPGDGS